MSPRRLPRSWFARDVLDVAPDLLGCTIEHAGVTVRVTETEAYGGWRQDPGSHAFRGETRRTAPMFGPAGVTYVYFTYGMHWMLCLVTGPAGQAQAVLVRAGEVIAGHPVAQARRVGVSPRDWTRGPARLASALALDGSHSGRDLCVPTLSPRTAGLRLLVRTGPRVGVSGPGGDGTAYPWRFWLEGERSVSSYRPAGRRRSVAGR